MSGRRRFIYRKDEETGEVHSIEVTPDYQPEGEGRAPLFTDRIMEGQTVEGPNGELIDIGSRKKREAYKKANGLEDYSDFREHFKKKAAERARPRRGEDLAQAIGRAYDTLSKRG